MSGPSAPAAVPDWQFDVSVEAEADGDATADQLAVLRADRVRWGAALQRLLGEAQEFVVAARSLSGEERGQVLADAQSDHRRLAAAWDRFNGVERGVERGGERGVEPDDACGPRTPPTRATRFGAGSGAAAGLVEAGTCGGVGRGPAYAPR